MKPVARRLVVEWVLKSREELSSETVSSSMKSCALGLAIDGSEDNLISCFKEGKKCEEGGPRLQNQMLLEQDKEIEKDPFTISEEDITEAAPFFNIIEEDDVEGDIDID